ncbi:MAG: hypothetical protein QOH10_1925 [Actinomycetota bacterium]|nr:hypothetical protein [Actinomycetota bacterium]
MFDVRARAPVRPLDRSRPDEGPQSFAATVPLALEREQPGLEPDAAAPEENEERGNRRRAQQGQRHVPYVGVPGELEGRHEDAGGDRGDDSDRLLDRRVAPDRSVQADDLIEEELRRDRDQEIRNGRAHAEGRGAGESREVAQEPRGADDAEVQHPQARRAPSARESVHGPRETMWIRTRIRTLVQRRRRQSTHPCSPPAHRSPGLEPAPSGPPTNLVAVCAERQPKQR